MDENIIILQDTKDTNSQP